MRIGISGMWLSNQKGAFNSGLSRFASQAIGEMLRVDHSHEYVVFAPDDYTPPEEWGATGRCRVEPVAVGSLKQRVFWEHWTAGKVARSMEADLWFSAAQAIPFSGAVPRAVMIHDIIPILFPEIHRRSTVLYYRNALRYSARHAEVILANSECTKADLVHQFKIEASRVNVVHLASGNSVAPRDPAAVTDAEMEKTGIRYKRYLLWLGSIEPRKNPEALIRALAILRKDGDNQDLGLVFAGGGRDGYDVQLGVLIDELGIRDAVQSLGYLPDEALPVVFARATLFVFPSIYEGFGIPVLEAMMLGAPVAASRASSIPEVGGDAIAYFNPNDVDDLVRTVRPLLSDDQQRAKMVQAGFRRAATFTWGETARGMLRAFEAGVEAQKRSR